MRRKALWAAALLALVGLAFLAAPHLARYKLCEWAKTRGMTADAESVSIGFGEIELKSVKLTDPERVDAELDSVKVYLGASLSPKTVRILGGKVKLRGSREAKNTTGKSTGGPRIDAEGLQVQWDGWRGDGSQITASGVSFHRHDDELEVGMKSAEVSAGGLSARAEEVVLEKRDTISVKCRKLEAQSKSQAEVEKQESTTQVPSSPLLAKVEIEFATLEARGHQIEASGVSLNLARDGVVIHADGGIRSVKSENAQAEAVIVHGGAKLGPTISIGGELAVGKLTLLDGRLSDEPAVLSGVNATIQLKKEGRSMSATGQVSVQKAKVEFSGERKEDGWEFDAELPKTECGEAAAAIKSEVKSIGEIEMTGTLEASLHVVRRGTSVPQVEFHLNQKCKISKIGDGISSKLSGKQFTRTVWDAEGKEIQAVSGPNTDGWTRLGDMSPYLPLAAMTTEDPGFTGHRGFDTGAISNAIRDDIESGRFLRGASTISMQLAKNLWLDRQKTASRKLTEALLTIYLEQTLGKDRIMELYLNIVEFAPGIYGIGKAARHYFKTEPRDLSLSQSLFLTLMLPKPKGSYFEPGGRLSAQRMKLIYVLMKAMNLKKWISDQEYAEGLGEWVVEGESRPGRVTPGTVKVEGDPDASEWQ